MRRLLMIFGIRAAQAVFVGMFCLAVSRAADSPPPREGGSFALGSALLPAKAAGPAATSQKPPTAAEAAEDGPAIDLRGLLSDYAAKLGGYTARRSGPGTLNDPTQPGPQMRQLLGPKGQIAELPTVQLKGRIVAPGQPPLVYMGIDKEVYAARQGDEFSPTGKYSGLTFRVTSVTKNQVRIDVAPLNRTLVLY